MNTGIPHIEPDMTLAQITVSSEVGIGLAGSIVAAMALAIGVIYRQMVANNEAQLKALTINFDKQLAALDSDRNSWREMAEELGINIEKAVNRKRAAAGRPPFNVMQPIVPEHSSPVTAQQQQTADIGTMRARLVAATKELGEDQRPQPPPATPRGEAAAAAAAPGKAVLAADKIIAASETPAVPPTPIESAKAIEAADAMHDAAGAIDVAKVAVDAAAVAIQHPEEDK